MSSKFECVVEIHDQKYEIVLNENDLTLMCFKEIYPKIQQIVKIALNEDIDFNTHEFKKFKNNSTEGSVIWLLEDYIFHKSLIKIKPKSQQMNTSSDFIPLSHSTINGSTQPSPRNVPTNQLSELSLQKDVPSANTFKSYCDVCPVVTDGNNYQLGKKWKKFLDNDRKHYSIFPLFDIIAEISDNNYNNMTENDWFHVIPRHMRQFGENKNNWKKYFTKLTKKYIRILKLCENPIHACNLFPFFHYFESITFVSNHWPFKDINALRDMRGCSSYGRRSKQHFKTSLKRLIGSETDIKEFYSIVMAIDIKWDLKSFKHNNYWPRISNKLMKGGVISRRQKKKRAVICKQKFKTWTEFYAQNYDRLNGKLEAKHQQIFDLLKIIHILDVKKVCPKTNICDKIIEISSRDEFKDYYEKHLKDIRMRKLEALSTNNTNEEQQSVAPIPYDVNGLQTDSYDVQPISDSNVSQTNGKFSKFKRTLETEVEENAISSNVGNESTNKKLKPILTIYLD